MLDGHRLVRVKELIDARYAEPLDLQSLAGAAQLSCSQFSRRFRRAFGEAPHQYLMARRMERAAALLRNTDWPVARICRAVGLRSVGSFTTSFGRTFGASPASYRAGHEPLRARIPPGALRMWATPREPETITSSRGRSRRARSAARG